MKKRIKKKGLTLVELIVTMAVLGIVLTMVFQIFISQTKIYNSEIYANEAQNSGSFCINSISEAIRLAATVTPNDPNAGLVSIAGLGSSKQIVQVTPYEGGSTYQYLVNQNKVYKYISSTSYSLIASNVNKVTVTSSGSVYTIYVEIINGNSIKSFTTSVSLRNRGL